MDQSSLYYPPTSPPLSLHHHYHHLSNHLASCTTIPNNITFIPPPPSPSLPPSLSDSRLTLPRPARISHTHNLFISPRLVLSLTASNLLLTLVVLPVLVASVVLGPPYHDPNSPPRTTFLVLASQNSSLANATEQGVSALRLERSVAPEEVTSHDVDPQPVWESLEGEQDLAESWMGPDNATRGLEEEEETAVQDRVGSAWGGGGGVGSAALCQGAAFLANLVTAASAITVAIIALDR
ncbi:hypothetical protein E2C01_066023 [Portunus trituberculatus]|uniref:Uncharacterized protein n=1 Tax=Portunus trituberculatus TaxID=210409 RepID=A0A5B7HR77_PORTR|nr:hypothetical protein [Portunus trituberculatus]